MVLHSILVASAVILIEIVSGEFKGQHVAYTRPVRSCMSASDCDIDSGESCYRLYDGCSMGQCMCDPRRRKQESAKLCTSAQRRANETCESHDACREGMTCLDGFCRCIKGSVTSDGLFCLDARHRLIGQPCQSSVHTCLQKSVYGYTSNDVVCAANSQCACADGYRLDGVTCSRRRVEEFGCLKSQHCERGAICVDRRCRCPTGYHVPPGYAKCIGRDVVINLPIGAACDDISGNLYCSPNLVCHRCDARLHYKCVKFLTYPDYSFWNSSPSTHQRHGQTSSVVRSISTGLLLIRLLLRFSSTRILNESLI